jgi:Zn finger protein HypA/HybF involved in hydrogenase expression
VELYNSAEVLVKKVDEMLSGLFTKRIFVETDMRAHRNPTQMKVIKKATEDLIKNIFSLCPKCRAPGFVVVDFEKGLKCSRCGIPTDLTLNDIYHCDACDHREKKAVTKYGKTADPQYCGYCNP